MKLVQAQLDSASRGRIPTAASPDEDDDHLWLTKEVARDVCCLTLATLNTQALELTVTISAKPAPTVPIWLRATGQSGNTLGDPPEHRVDPAEWRKGVAVCRVPLSAPMGSAAVGRRRGIWAWQWRDGQGASAPLGSSEHLLFAIVDLPTFPWTTAVKPRRDEAYPWAGALALACDWASGARTLPDVPGRIAQAAFDLHKADPPWSYSSSAMAYMNPNLVPSWFDCAGFINAARHVRSVSKNDRLLSCYEAAAVVTTFANVLGCSLGPVMISNGDCQDFRANPVYPMGLAPDNCVCFSGHVVACETGGKPEQQRAFDPVLRLDVDHNPAAPAHQWALTFDHRLGTTASPAGQGMYLPQLIAASDIASCTALPMSIAQVWPPSVYDNVEPCFLLEWLHYMEELRADPPSRFVPITFSIPNFQASATITVPAGPRRPAPFSAIPPRSRTMYTANADATIHLAADFWSGSADQTRSVMAELLAQAEQRPIRVQRPGRILYRDRYEETLWTLIDGAAVRLSNVGRRGVKLLAILDTATPQ
jgi:hypothetical protein